MAHDLLSDALSTLDSCLGHIDHDLFEPLREPPWVLCEGDIESNLIAHARTDIIYKIEMANDLRWCVNNNVSMPDPCMHVGNLRDVRHSNNRGEQDRAAVSLAKKFHSFEISMLVARSYLYNNVPLVRAPRGDPLIKCYQRRLAQLQLLEPNKLNGKAVFV